MSQEVKKIRIGPKEQQVLAYLYDNGEAWVSELITQFVYASKYQRFFGRLLHRLEKKGLVLTRVEYCPATKRQRKYISLSSLGEEVVKDRLLQQS